MSTKQSWRKILGLLQQKVSEGDLDIGPVLLFWIPGVVLAMIISFVENKSVFWAVLHAAAGWFYVLFHVVCGGVVQ